MFALRGKSNWTLRIWTDIPGLENALKSVLKTRDLADSRCRIREYLNTKWAVQPYYVRHVCTYVKEVSSHAAAMTHLVPIGSLGTRIVEVARQAAVVTVPIGALGGQVARGSTKEAGHRLLFSQKDTTHVSLSRPSWEISRIRINAHWLLAKGSSWKDVHTCCSFCTGHSCLCSICLTLEEQSPLHLSLCYRSEPET